MDTSLIESLEQLRENILLNCIVLTNHFKIKKKLDYEKTNLQTIKHTPSNTKGMEENR